MEKKEETHTVFVVIVQIGHSLSVWTVHCICEQNRNRKYGPIDGSVGYKRALGPLEDL